MAIIDQTAISFQELIEKLKKIPGKSHLLLGNGVNMARNRDFDWGNLWRSKAEELCEKSPRIANLVSALGTNNFESIIKSLLLCKEQGLHYFRDHLEGMSEKEIDEDIKAVQNALIEAVIAVHPEGKDCTIEEQKHFNSFLKNFNGNIYNMNYDLIAYRCVMPLVESGNANYDDEFRKDGDNDRCIWRESYSNKRKLFYPHGNLALSFNRIDTFKHVWRLGGNILQQVQQLLKGNVYPLYVADGDHVNKLQKIISCPYLYHCEKSLRRIGGVLITFGFSFSEADHHISLAIAQSNITHLFIGIVGKIDSEENVALVQRIKKLDALREERNACRDKKNRVELTIEFYQAESADIWGKNKVTEHAC